MSMSGSFSCADPYAALLDSSDDVLGILDRGGVIPLDRGGVVKSSREMYAITSADAVHLASLAADRNLSAWRRNLFRTVMKNNTSLFNIVFVQMVKEAQTGSLGTKLNFRVKERHVNCVVTPH